MAFDVPPCVCIFSAPAAHRSAPEEDEIIAFDTKHSSRAQRRWNLSTLLRRKLEFLPLAGMAFDVPPCVCIFSAPAAHRSVPEQDEIIAFGTNYHDPPPRSNPPSVDFDERLPEEWADTTMPSRHGLHWFDTACRSLHLDGTGIIWGCDLHWNLWHIRLITNRNSLSNQAPDPHPWSRFGVDAIMNMIPEEIIQHKSFRNLPEHQDEDMLFFPEGTI